MGFAGDHPKRFSSKPRSCGRRVAALLIALLTCVLAYVLLAEWAGFVVTAAVLLMLLAWRMGARWPVAAAVSVLIVPLAYQVFAVSLRVPLPRGWLGW